MTKTETLRRRSGAPSGPWTALVRAAVVTLAGGLAVALLGLLLGGGGAAPGALAGTAFVLCVLVTGAFAVQYVARAIPAVSLLFALLTYTFQVVLMALAFVLLTRSGVLDGPLDRTWFAGTIVAGTVVWLVAQVVVTTRQRIPVYELAEAGR